MPNPSLLLIAVLSASFVEPALATDRIWENPNGGLFHANENWMDGIPPGVDDAGVFGLLSTYDVTAVGEPMVRRLVFRQGDVTLRTLLTIFTIDSPSSLIPALTVGESEGDNSTVHFEGAGAIAELNITSIGIGWETGSIGAAHLVSPLLEMTVEAEITVGAAGEGSLALQPECELEANQLVVGWAASGTGSLDCENAVLDIADSALFGVNGLATAMIRGGSQFTVASLALGVQGAGDASMTITGAGTQVGCAGSFDAGIMGHADIFITDGGRLWVQDTLILGMIPEDGFGSPGGSATLRLDGPQSRLNVFGDCWVGMLGFAELIVSHDARVDVGGGVITASPDSSMTIELAADDDFGSPAIAAGADIDAIPLTVTLADGYVPARGARFELLHAGTALNAPTPTLPSLPGGVVWTVTTTATTLVIQTIADPDLDGNGAVDFNDLLLLLAAWGPCPNEDCLADLNGDHIVGFADLILLLGAWT